MRRIEPFQLNPTQLGWLVGIFSLVQLFSAPLIGKLSDRIGRKPVLLVSIIGTAIGYFVTGAASAAWMLFLGRIIDGASGGNIATAQACIADTTTPQERSKAMGMIGAAFGLGFILGPAIGGVLSQWGHQMPFYFAGGLSLLNAVFVVARLPETLSAEQRLHPAAKAPLGEVFAGGRGGFIGLLLAATLTCDHRLRLHPRALRAVLRRSLWLERRKQTGYAFAYVGLLAVLVQGGLLRQLLKRDIEKELAVIGAALLAREPVADAALGERRRVSRRVRADGAGQWPRHARAQRHGVAPCARPRAGPRARPDGRRRQPRAFPRPRARGAPAAREFLARSSARFTGAIFDAVNAGYRTAFTASAAARRRCTVFALLSARAEGGSGEARRAPNGGSRSVAERNRVRRT